MLNFGRFPEDYWLNPLIDYPVWSLSDEMLGTRSRDIEGTSNSEGTRLVMLYNVSGRGSTRIVKRRSSHASSMLFRVELREKQAGLEMELCLKEMEVLKTKIPEAQNEVEMARLAESVEEEKLDEITDEDTKTEMLPRTEKFVEECRSSVNSSSNQ
ncbi:hypothetical protein D915_006811 [Fasciola hepatica]|uniref:Uncharacterized protein n=1 Tax=Fasciola hepatica TaxID=6192 RepID=A0A4E0R6C4_FASHE|nr:hypothetical protein D915_006811 [Fasciola hepatica]